MHFKMNQGQLIVSLFVSFKLFAVRPLCFKICTSISKAYAKLAGGFHYILEGKWTLFLSSQPN